MPTTEQDLRRKVSEVINAILWEDQPNGRANLVYGAELVDAVVGLISLERLDTQINTLYQAMATLSFEDLKLSENQVRSLSQWIDQLESQRATLTQEKG